MGIYKLLILFVTPEERLIDQELTMEERKLFHSLLKLAEASEYPGERENAMAAAKRIAERKGLTLEEAAMVSPPVKRQERPQQNPHEKEAAQHVHMMDHDLRMAKQRREEAMEAARSTARMPAEMHAWKLVTETTLPYQEISKITGLDIYQIVHMKIRCLRAA
jgi:pyruvate/2-oxoglutarate dehydrogenase complex dihydrolipoamide acyltransferase (E2) component